MKTVAVIGAGASGLPSIKCCLDEGLTPTCFQRTDDIAYMLDNCREVRMKTVAVIGAGASGLPSIKCCLDEGLIPTCFERTDDIGGLWNHTEAVRDGQACVMKSTVINTSKEMMSYSDFPIPKEFPIFLHHTLVQKYFNMYMENFNLKEHIQFNTEVLHVAPHEDFASTGQWVLQIRDRKSSNVTTKVFDAVMVATGHHANKKMPDFTGMENFKGEITHTHDYKTWEGYENKKIVVVGLGESGGDAAVELSRLFLSTRRGSWVFHRIAYNGEPVDMKFSRRVSVVIRKSLPVSIMEKTLQKRLNNRFDHAKYSLKPNHGIFSQHPTINNDIPDHIANGSIIVKPNIKCFFENGVEFDDGTREEVDVVILGTGYIFGFPFIDKSIIDVHNNQVDLYKYMFPPDLQKPTLSVIGCVQPLGALMPVSELQARLATRVFKGSVELPPRCDQWLDIRKKRLAMKYRYVESTRHTIQIDYIQFMDELAELTGCKPNLVQMMLSDPKLALQCFFGPCTPYQFRLEGPGTWTGAKKAILTQWDRTWFPLKTRPTVDKPQHSKSFYIYTLILLIIAYILHVILC